MSKGMARQNILFVFCLILTAAALAVRADAQGNGVIAAPTAAAYQELTNASYKMLKDLTAVLPQARTVVLYDPNIFSVIPYYLSTTDLVRTAAEGLCGPEPGAIAPRTIGASLDIGEAAVGLAGLVQLAVPTYASQSQALPLDNSALVASFATAARTAGYVVVNPAYLLPAVSQSALNCQSARASNSLSDLWKFANSEASRQAPNAALQAFQKMRQALTSSDKGSPLIGRVLAAESLARALDNPAQAAVIDMRLDAADIDSTTKSLLWWRKAKFSANIAAHYWIFSVRGQGEQFGIQLVAPGYVNILRTNVDLSTFAVGANH
jgi:hypothetical protein